MLGLGLLVFAGCSLLLLGLEHRLGTATGPGWLDAWRDQLVLPLARVLCLLLFIACAHPALYGLQQAPTLSQLLAAEPGRLDRFVNLLFLTGLLLPAIPVLGRVPGLILPVQGMVGVALVFSWSASAGGLAAPRLLPSLELALVLLALAALAMALASALSRLVADACRQQRLYSLLVLWLQLPVLLVYAEALGRQLRSH